MVRRLAEWTVQLAVWLVGMDLMALMTGIPWWKAMLIGFAGVVLEEVIGIVRQLEWH